MGFISDISAHRDTFAWIADRFESRPLHQPGLCLSELGLCVSNALAASRSQPVLLKDRLLDFQRGEALSTIAEQLPIERNLPVRGACSDDRQL